MLQVCVKLERKPFQFISFVVNNYVFASNSSFEGLASVMCSFRDELASLRSEVTELKNFNETDDRALGNVDGITQDASKMKTPNQYLPNNNKFESNVRPNTGNEAIQEDVQPQTLT